MEIEKIIAILLPPACREHTLGDLRERSTTTKQKLGDLFLTVPAVVWSQMRRSTPPLRLLAQGLAAYVAFAAPVFLMPGDHASALFAALAPALVALVVLVLADTYWPAGIRPLWRQVPVVVASGAAGLAAARVLPPTLASVAALMACALIATVRMALSSGQSHFRLAQAGPLSMEQVRSRAQMFEKEIRGRNRGGYVVSAVLTAAFGSFAFIFPNAIQRMGACLTVAGALFMVFQLRLSAIGSLPADAGEDAHIRFFRKELERQRDFHRGVWFWLRLAVFLPGPLLFNLGFAMAHPELASFLRVHSVLLLVFGGLAIPLNFKQAREYQRQIDQLASSLEE